MATVNLSVNNGETRRITFKSAGTYNPEDIVFDVTGEAGSTTIAAGASGDTNQLTLSANTKYKLTSAGSTFVFTTPPDHTYNFSGVSFTSTNSTATDKNANNLTGNGTYYYASNGPATSLGASTDDGGLYVQAYNTSWVGQIAQDYRNGRLFVRGKNNGTWSAWKRIANYDEVATSGHTHSTSIATSTGTNQITLAFGGKYAITAGGTSYVFTMPSNPDTDIKVKQTAHTTTDATEYPIITTTVASPTSGTAYEAKYATQAAVTGSGDIVLKKSSSKCKLQFDNSLNCLNFIFE